MNIDIAPLAVPLRNTSTPGSKFQQPADCPIAACPSISMYQRELERHKATESALRESLIRESELLRQKDLLSKESEHRLLNGLQLVTSLLTLQSLSTGNAEASAQLKVAANRVATLGRVHLHLHALDHVQNVEFKQYLETLCQDLAGIASSENSKRVLVVEGNELKIPSVIAIPLGFIASELLTNSIKYAKGKVTVRLDTTSGRRHAMSISDEGPGLPEGFNPGATHGLGMKIVSALVRQIGGELQIAKSDNGHGARFTVLFS